jgi:hypothetical protein
MSVVSVKVEDRLDGVSNFLPWKARLILLLKEKDLWDTVHSGLPVVAQGAQQDPILEKKDIKAQRVILEAVKDHLILHVSEKTSAKEMYDALVLTNLQLWERQFWM